MFCFQLTYLFALCVCLVLDSVYCVRYVVVLLLACLTLVVCGNSVVWV